jgi:hypothetical protein
MLESTKSKSAEKGTLAVLVPLLERLMEFNDDACQ